MYVVRGIKHSTGEYQGNPYDNMMVHCDASDDGKMVCGEPVVHIKVKTPRFNEICANRNYKPADFVGNQIRVYYGPYNVVEDLEILK